MNTLQAGFARVNVTPMLGIDVVGYFQERRAEGVLDDLYLDALALCCGDTKVLLMSIDVCYMNNKLSRHYQEHISKATGVPVEAIYLACSHTHTGPNMSCERDELDELASGDPLVKEYVKSVEYKMADVAVMALADLKPARMGWGIGQAPNIAFIRRFRMKDGSIRTNPGVDHPDIVEPIGTVDERVTVLRFDREGGETIVLVNFADHPDVVGGNLISADWPGFLKQTVEKTLDNTKCIFFNGAQGDVNHVNVHPRGGYLNDMFMDFDDVARGYKHAQYMGRVVTGGVLQVYDKVKYVDVDTLKFGIKMVEVPANNPSPEEMEQARYIDEMHKAGRDEELPYKGMMLTTMVAQAARMVRLEHGPYSFTMPVSAVRIGDVAMVGIPGEPFTGVGRGLKLAEGWDVVIPTCLTNGAAGYFPMQEAYDEGGYEAGSSSFKAGVAELLIGYGKALLETLKD